MRRRAPTNEALQGGGFGRSLCSPCPFGTLSVILITKFFDYGPPLVWAVFPTLVGEGAKLAGTREPQPANNGRLPVGANEFIPRRETPPNTRQLMEEARDGFTKATPVGDNGPTPEPALPMNVENHNSDPAASGTGASGQAHAKTPVSANKVAANRKNGQKSPGPQTEAGKARSAANSYKHGFFAKRLFHTAKQAAADKDDYVAVVNGVFAAYQPVGFMESLWAEKIAVELLRLARLMGYEQNQMAQWMSPFGGPATANILRYQTTGNRLLNQAIEELERLQSKRKAEEAATEHEEPAEGDTAVEPDAPAEGLTSPEQD